MAIEQPESTKRFISSESPQHLDAVIVGGGIAGIWTARMLSEHGVNRIAVIEPRTRPAEKSLLMHGAVLDKFDLWGQLHQERGDYNPIDRYKMIYPDKHTLIDVKTADNPQNKKGHLLGIGHDALLHAINGRTANELWQTGVTRVSLERGKILVTLRDKSKISTDILVDATGSGTPLSRHLIFNEENIQYPLIDDNPIVLWCHGQRVKGDVEDVHTLYHPASSTTGSGSWILPWGNGEIDIIAAGFCRLSDLKNVPRELIYDRFLEYCLANNLVEGISQDKETVRGFIRMQPVGKQSTRLENVFIVGDAAGVGSPAYGEVIPAILSNGEYLTDVVKKNGPSLEYFNLWRHKKAYFPYAVEQAILKMKVEPLNHNNHKKSSWEIEEGAGSNSIFYETMLRCLPSEIQQQVLLTRRLPLQYIPRIAYSLSSSTESLKYMANFGRHYLYTKISEQCNIMP